MSMLDQMLIEGVRRTATENKPWNAGQFLTNVGQFVNTGERINELQRQNSLRNLIKQREQDGVSFDRLSNEAAKYDLNKALTMRNEARDSIKFNRTESEAELANHKKYMAGWLGGEVLRRAQEAVARGDAQWDIDYVVNVCNETAATIYPYDPEGARALMQYANGLSGKKIAAGAKAKPKKFEDDIKHLNNVKSNLYNISTTAKNEQIRQIAAAEYDRINLLESEIGARRMPVYAWMPGFLKKNWNKSSGYMDAINKLIDSYDATQPNRLEYNVYGDVDNSDLDKINAATGGKLSYSGTGATNTDKKNTPSSSEGGKGKYSFVDRIPTSLGEVVKAHKNGYNEIAEAIKNVNYEDLPALSAAIDEFKNSEGAQNANLIDKLINSKIKEYEDIKTEIGTEVGTEDLKRLKDLIGTRNMNSAVVRPLRNFSSAMSTYLNTDTPYTAISNWILVTQPDYKYINDDIEMAKTLSTGKWSTDVKSFFATAAPFKMLRDAASRAQSNNVMYAMAKDGTSAMRTWWNGVTKGRSEEEKKQIKTLYSRLFGLDDDIWPYIEGKVRVPTPEERENLKKKSVSREMELPTIEEYKVNPAKSADADKDAKLKAFLEGK